MNGRGIRLWIPCALVLLCAGLAFDVNAKLDGRAGLIERGVNFYATWRDAPVSAPGARTLVLPALKLAPLAATPTFTLAPLARFEELIERPLFSASRRPPSEEAPKSPEAAPEAPLDLVLRGVVLTGNRRIALLQSEKGERKALRLLAGDSHAGWVLKAIEADNVTFERDEEIRVLELAFEEPPPPPPKRARSRRERKSVRPTPRRQQNSAGARRRGSANGDNNKSGE